MANTANITKIGDGDRSAIFHIFIQGDGLTGDISKLTIIDPNADLNPSLGRRPSLTITEIWHSFAGFSGKLEFDYLNDETGTWVLPDGNPSHMNFDSIGGLKDRSNSLDGTGKLMLTTIGLLSANCCGSMIIKVRKD